MKTRYLRLVKKQRGFTLIELLAVILILGIIALIAIPTVSSVVEQSRRGAAESSASSFINSVEEMIVIKELEGSTVLDGFYSVSELEDMGLNIKGDFPDNGIIQIAENKVVDYSLLYNDYNIKKDGEKNEINKENPFSSFVLKEDNDSNKIVSLGDKVCLDTECFYVMSVNNETNEVRMLAEWNLNVGYKVTYNGGDEIPHYDHWDYQEKINGYTIPDTEYINVSPSNSSLIKQDSSYLGEVEYNDNYLKFKGIINFSSVYNGSTTYWTDKEYKYGDTYPVYVYDENSTIYSFVNAYEINLKYKSASSMIKSDLINLTDLENIGCLTTTFQCDPSKPWILQTTYWTGIASASKLVYSLSKAYNRLRLINASLAVDTGVRPVITIPKSIIESYS